MLVTLVAQWYKPAMNFLGTVHDFSLEYPSVYFSIIDVDTSKDLMSHLGCLPQPGFLFYQHGKKVTEVTGINLFGNTAELETILRFEIEKTGAARVEVSKPTPESIIQQAIHLAKPGANSTLKLRPEQPVEDSIAPSPAYKYFPSSNYALWNSTANMAAIESKISTFANEIPACKLDSDQLITIRALISLLSDQSNFANSKFEDGQLEQLEKMLLTWPIENAFPIIDLLRLVLLHPIGRVHFLRSPIIPSMIESIPSASFAYQFLAFKAFSNLFESRITKELILNNFEKVLKAVDSLSQTTNKNLQLVMSTTLLNYATFLKLEGINEDIFVPTPLIQSIKSLLRVPQSDDSTFRLIISVATLAMNGSAAKSELPEIIELAKKQEITSEHCKAALDDLSSF